MLNVIYPLKCDCTYTEEYLQDNPRDNFVINNVLLLHLKYNFSYQMIICLKIKNCFLDFCIFLNYITLYIKNYMLGVFI
jgi:hypothetical protein